MKVARLKEDDRPPEELPRNAVEVPEAKAFRGGSLRVCPKCNDLFPVNGFPWTLPSMVKFVCLFISENFCPRFFGGASTPPVSPQPRPFLFGCVPSQHPLLKFQLFLVALQKTCRFFWGGISPLNVPPGFFVFQVSQDCTTASTTPAWYKPCRKMEPKSCTATPP